MGVQGWMWIPIRFEVRGLCMLIRVQGGRMAKGMKLQGDHWLVHLQMTHI